MRKEFFFGPLASFGLLGFYFLIFRLTGMPQSAAVEQFRSFWPWILTLVLGFGIQMGFYTHLRSCQKKGDGKVVVASGGMSGVAMVACCAHHLIDVLPILGFSAASVFLAQYQIWFLALGVFSNILGIGYMAKIMRKNETTNIPRGRILTKG